jgi:type 1 fimbria pilin
MRAAVPWLMLLLLALVPLGAQAECRYDSGGNTSVTFSLPATISIPANTPDGTVLAISAQATPANPPDITCGYYYGHGNNKWRQSDESLIYGVANSRGGNIDNQTYDTGIPGISYRITHPVTYLTAYPLNSDIIGAPSSFSVTSGLELIKTGSIASGSTLAAGPLGDWKWVDSEGNILIPETFWLGNSITFTTPSCTLVANPINVTLPAVTTSALAGVGSTSGKTPFQILLNCPTGTAVTRITMHTALPDSHAGVIAPTVGAGYAAGVGVQILDGNSNAVVFENQTVVTPPNATTSIPYFAQYFQTAPTVSGGNVKATVTFDIFYQ